MSENSDWYVYRPQVGDRVRYLGYTRAQVDWGNNDVPYMLIRDRIYTVEDVEVHRQHTKVKIKGVVGNFNSVHFILTDE